jgi:hypothetical protein
MDVFIYWYGAAPTSRDELEDTIDAILGDKGEVTGSGEGDTGGNIDIEFYQDADSEPLMSEIVRSIAGDLPRNAFYIADDEERRPFLYQLPGAAQVPEHLLAAAGTEWSTAPR